MINVYKTKTMQEKYNTATHNPFFNKHQIPISHMLVSGASASGKSNFVTNLIMQMNDTFAKVVVVSKVPDEPIYDMLKHELEDQFESYTLSNVPKLVSFEKPNDSQYLMIFDDFTAEKQPIFDKLLEYGIRSRKEKIMCIFLVPDFFLDKIKTLRQQCPCLVLLSIASQGTLGLIAKRLAIKVHNNIVTMCIENALEYKLNACIINTTAGTPTNKKIRRNFTDFYELTQRKNGKEIVLDEIELYDEDVIIN